MNTNHNTTNSKPASPISAVALSHHFAGAVLRPGDLAVDATAGNGHDTVFLAQCVGEAGRVFAFDVQEDALRQTKTLAARENLSARIEFFRLGHEKLAGALKPCSGQIRAAMFNLGYLPGGDKTLITRTETTIAGLDAARRVLAPGGRIVIVAYPGHEGGAAEAEAVRAWIGRLPRPRFETFACQLLTPRPRGTTRNTKPRPSAPAKSPPILWTVDNR